jgi:glutaredoxin-like protein NrdH
LSLKRKNMTVTVYSKPSCVKCTATYRALRNAGVEFETVDVTQDEDGYNAVVALGYLEMPVVVAGEDHWSGFREEKIVELAKQAA